MILFCFKGSYWQEMSFIRFTKFGDWLIDKCRLSSGKSIDKSEMYKVHCIKGIHTINF